MSGALQGAIIALAAGYHLSAVPAGAPTKWWPYLLFGWAFIAAVTPWLLGGILDEEMRLLNSLILGVVMALPFWAASRWLAHTPYHRIALGCWGIVALWALHLMVSAGVTIMRAWRPRPPRSV